MTGIYAICHLKQSPTMKLFTKSEMTIKKTH